MLYKRFSLVAYTFLVTHFGALFRETDFFNSYRRFRKQSRNPNLGADCL